jgi:F0F1-type ATP synthase assembly protein I
MNETTAFRRVAATLTIGSFSIAALMGIAALLGAGSFGESEARVLLTTLVVGCASVCVLCYLATAGTRWQAVGGIGSAVVLLPTVTSLLLVWSDWEDTGDGVLRAFGVGVVLAVTLAQVCLLLGVAGSRPNLRLVLGATVLLAMVVAIIVSSLILGGDGSGDIWRVLGVVAILDVLGTLVTIALAKFVRADEPSVPDGRVRITLTGDQAVMVESIARRTGRSPEHLVAEAVDRFLLAEARS